MRYVIISILGLLSLGAGPAPMQTHTETGTAQAGFKRVIFDSPFSKVPTCVCSVQAGSGADRVCSVESPSPTSVSVYTVVEGRASGEIFHLVCME